MRSYVLAMHLMDAVEILARRGAKPYRAGGRKRFKRQRLAFQGIPAAHELRLSNACGDNLRSGKIGRAVFKSARR